MPKSTLDQIFGEGYPDRAPAQNHSRLTAQERRFILWGQKEKWPATRIASALGVQQDLGGRLATDRISNKKHRRAQKRPPKSC